ncbi:unnamed protein product [Sphagnum jensenii]|uniref:Uncharacterized protein n=1 Tax=Sphagnum jensenii TaxID=128206 RepID=A0ABP1C0U4_9BRYO
MVGSSSLLLLHGPNPVPLMATHTCALGPDGVPSVHISSVPSPPTSSVSSLRIFVRSSRDRSPAAQRHRRRVLTSERAAVPVGLPPLSPSPTSSPSVSGSGSYGLSRSKKPEGGRRSSSLKYGGHSSNVKFEAAKVKTMRVDLEIVEKEAFQPHLGWPFSNAEAHDFQTLDSVEINSRDLETLFLKSQEQGLAAGEDDQEVVSRPRGGLYSSWSQPPRRVDEEEDGFTPMLLVASQSTPSPRQKQESSERDNFYANCGSAIRILREELPCLFFKDLSFDIYRDDVVFQDPMNTFKGIDNYKLIFWALRFHGRIFFKALWVDIIRVWQPSDNVIMVRWTVHGIPRVPWEAQGHFDGTSEYKLDKDGRIYEHKVDNVIMNSPPKFQPRSVMDLVRAVGGNTTPTPSFFQRAGIFCQLLSSYLQQCTWVRFYWALSSTLALKTSSGDGCNEMVPSLNP